MDAWQPIPPLMNYNNHNNKTVPAPSLQAAVSELIHILSLALSGDSADEQISCMWKTEPAKSMAVIKGS